MTPSRLVGVSMSGGLGNQLFAYAVGLAVARRVGGDLRFDLRYYTRPGARPLELSAFGLSVRAWTPTWWKLEALARRASQGRWRPGPERLLEMHEFEPAVLSIDAPCFLRGFFQSWRYFAGAEGDIRRAFDTTPLATARTAPLEARIAGASSPVMVHLRRGDYGDATFPLLGREHYEQARARVEAEVPEPTYFIFSDDARQAATLFAGWPRVVLVQGLSGLEDFRLMSLCRHFIIANSTYSWWAAWLGGASDKRVVAPSRWYGHGVAGQPIDLDARLPPEWIRV